MGGRALAEVGEEDSCIALAELEEQEHTAVVMMTSSRSEAGLAAVVVEMLPERTG